MFTQHHGHILRHCQRTEQCAALEHHAPAPPQRQGLLIVEADDFPAEHADRTGHRPQQHDDGAQQRGLAATAAAHQRENLARSHRQTDVLVHHGHAVACVQLANVDNGAG